MPPKAAAGVRGTRLLRALRGLADDSVVAVSVQLDHANELTLIESAVQAGADAVLADGSLLPMKANASFVARAREIVGTDVSLEAELDNIAGDEDIAQSTGASPFAEPAEVKEFLELSGADLLAVSVGNAHGRYAGVPQLGWPRIAELMEVAAVVPLVLHGASGLSLEDIEAAPAAGIGKINFNTELRSALFTTLSESITGHIDRGLDMVGLQQDWNDSVSLFARTILHRLSA